MANQIAAELVGAPTCDFAPHPERVAGIVGDIVSGMDPLHITSASITEAVGDSCCNTCEFVTRSAGSCALRQGLADAMYVKTARADLEMLEYSPGWLAVYRLKLLEESGIAGEIQEMSLMSSGDLLEWRERHADGTTAIHDTLAGVYNTRVDDMSIDELPKELADTLKISDDSSVRTDRVRFGNGWPVDVSDLSGHLKAQPLHTGPAASLVADYVRLMQSTNRSGDPMLLDPEARVKGKPIEITRFDWGIIFKISGSANGHESGLYGAYLPTEPGKPGRCLFFGGYDDSSNKRDFLRDSGLENLINPTGDRRR